MGRQLRAWPHPRYDASMDEQRHFPRFMTDQMLRDYFGLTERSLRRVRSMREFPKRDVLVGKTDSKAVDRFFDKLAGLEPGLRRPVTERDRF